jgi:uncharacterized protein
MRVLRFALVPALLLGLAAVAARAVTLEQIPSPRPIGWVVDQTGALPPETLAELNRLGDDVKSRTGAEMAVVVVNTTDGVDSHEFATRLYNDWGIASRGVLVFAALTDRKAEIVLGDGAYTEAARQESQIVMNVEMTPRFRTGDPAGAILEGARACTRRILEVQPASTAEPLPAAPVQPLVEPDAAPAQPMPQEFAVPVQDPRSSSRWLVVWTWILGVLALATVLAVKFRPVRCPKCREKMQLLGESEDDAHLQETERLEENIGSVDHKVWVCPACGELKKGSSVSWFSGYRNCPQCGVRALKADSWTVEEATYDHGGLVQTDEACASCSYKNSYTRSTSRLVRTETRDDSSSASAASASFLSSSSSSSSSSSGSSSSGSSSSGSGFSGGSSSGGGASGSW